MDKRENSRFKARLLVKIDEKTAVINDISRTGLNISVPIMPKKRRVNISLEFENMKLEFGALIMWARRKLSYGDKNILGLTIINPNDEYFRICEQFE